MKKIGVFLAFLFTSVVITACTHNFTEEFLYDYPVKDFKKAKGIVFDIRTEKGLYTPPVFLAKVELKPIILRMIFIRKNYEFRKDN